MAEPTAAQPTAAQPNASLSASLDDPRNPDGFHAQAMRRAEAHWRYVRWRRRLVVTLLLLGCAGAVPVTMRLWCDFADSGAAGSFDPRFGGKEVFDYVRMQELARLRQLFEARVEEPAHAFAKRHSELEERLAAIERTRQREKVTVELAFDRGQLTHSDLKLVDLIYVSTELFDSFGESSRLINRVVDWSDFAEPLQLATSVRRDTVEIRTEVTLVSAEGEEVESLALAARRQYGGFRDAIDRARPGPIWPGWSSSEFVLTAR